jgi:hypothetical protein
MFVEYQMASKSPVVSVVAKLNGVAASRMLTGSDLSDFGSIWFYAPPSGFYKLSVLATNGYGCVKEAQAPFDVVVK